jgi:hypothetical protein
LFLGADGWLLVEIEPDIAATTRMAMNGALRNWIARNEVAAKTQCRGFFRARRPSRGTEAKTSATTAAARPLKTSARHVDPAQAEKKKSRREHE